MIKTIILLSMIYTLSWSQEEEGSDCDEGTIITAPSGHECCIEGENQCPSATPLSDTQIECGENFSCCQCPSIVCGPNCDKFVAGGDSAAFGVPSITINGNSNDPVKMECGGDHSCQDATITASYVSELNCGGDNSCQNLKITINDGYVENVICGGDYACNAAQIIINNPADDFQLECKEPYSCQDLTLVITVPSGSSVSDFKAFGCEAESACERASITINNNGNNAISIEELKCEAPAACKNSIFNLVGPISFDNCKCGSQGGCLGTIGISDCFENMDKMECKGAACENEDITIINPSNDFELICENCKGSTIKIVISDDAKDGPITDLKSFKCGDPGACDGATINVQNDQNGITVNVEKIECNNGENACNAATFNSVGSGNVIFEEILCEYASCNGCVAKGVDCNNYP